MKRITALVLVSLLAACATTPFTFDGENASKGFVVLSTGLSKACLSEFNHTNLIIRNAKTDEKTKVVKILNTLFEPEFDNNNVEINGFPLEAGEYVIRDFMSPTPLFPAIPRFHEIKPIKLSVTSGQVQYEGYLFFDALNGACSKDAAKVTKKDMKKRDMKKMAEVNPQLISAL